MKRTYSYILDVLSSIQEIEEFIGDMDFEEFIKDRKTVTLLLEVWK